MPSRFPVRPFHCPVIDEPVSISLRRRRRLDGRGPFYVHCSEADCQYVETNQPPCPLTLELFAEELERRAQARSETP
jgi:hypothetical protein